MTRYTSVDEYIKAQPAAIADRLINIRNIFHDVLPETTESIRYQLPAFSVGREHLYMSAYKNHIGLYPMYGIPELEEEVQLYRGKNTKDALHFKHSDPLPVDLIRKIIIAKNNK